MYRSLTSLTLAFLLFPMIASAQWERLPLFAGHADRLVQNKYKPNEIFAIVQNGGIYKSADYGDTWATVVNDLDGLWKSEYVQELSFEVTGRGDYYVSSNKEFWVSRDEGKTWKKDSFISTKQAANYNRVIAHIDRSLILDRRIDQPFYLISDNYGDTWDTVRTPKFSIGTSWSTLLIDPEDSKIVFLGGGQGELLQTTDRGSTWMKRAFPIRWCNFLRLDRIQSNGHKSYLLWIATTNVSGGFKCDIYESTDSGATWLQKNTQASILRNNLDWSRNPAVYYHENTMVFCNWNTVYRSIDAGATWDMIPGPGVWDMINTPSGFLLSTTFDGIQLSTDTCKTWHSTSGTRAFPGSAKMEVAVATKDVSYAILLDNDYVNYSHAEFLRSSDCGDSWDVLFTSKWLEHIAVRYHEETRYFVVANKNTILSGTESQVTPDTVLTTGGLITELTVGEVLPYELVATVDYGGSFGFFISSDAGQTWIEHSFPPLSFQLCRILPSSLTSGTYTAIVKPNNSMNIAGMGIWHISDYGRSWVLKFEASGLRPITFALCANDELFWYDKKQFSSDHGRTWYDNFSGLTEDEKALLLSLLSHNSFKAIKSALLSGDAEHWLWYQDGSWRRLLDRIGNPLSRSIPASFDFVDDVLYAVYPKHGAYRTEVGNLATGTPSPSNPELVSLECYPNPLNNIVIISYKISSINHTKIQIVNTSGDILVNQNLESYEGSLNVDFSKIDENISSGVYYVRILDTDGIILTKSLVRIK